MSAPHADRDHSEQPRNVCGHVLPPLTVDGKSCGSPHFCDRREGHEGGHTDGEAWWWPEPARAVRASEAQVKAAMKALDCRRDEDECNTCYGSPWTDRGCEAAVAAADAVVAAGPDADEVTLAEHGRSVREVAREVYGSEIERLKGALANARAKYADEVTRLRADYATLADGYNAQVQHARRHLGRAEAAEAERDRMAEAVARVEELADIRTRAWAWMKHLGYTEGQILEAGRWKAPLDPAEEYEVPQAVRDLGVACDFAREYEEALRAALSGPTPAETPQNGPEPALSREQGASGQSGEGEALRGAENGEEAGR